MIGSNKVDIRRRVQAQQEERCHRSVTDQAMPRNAFAVEDPLVCASEKSVEPPIGSNLIRIDRRHPPIDFLNREAAEEPDMGASQ